MNNEALVQFMLGILNIVGFEGDREQEAANMAQTYDKQMAERMMDASREYFEEYFRAVAPTLTEDQKAELSNYFQQQSQQDGAE